ncbi:hypothetical protein SAMN05216378_4056 [Paenibacillus catalpae]|uniref:Uncharacterized protein n=1 Tax=Paenibacillus catalpae TaxID=1045775 RepID=A0A1I2DCI0_9BACL|nr:hypothetical protein SAMN05216378_4056 [Paenibacillus catalpae]
MSRPHQWWGEKWKGYGIWRIIVVIIRLILICLENGTRDSHNKQEETAGAAVSSVSIIFRTNQELEPGICPSHYHRSELA